MSAIARRFFPSRAKKVESTKNADCGLPELPPLATSDDSHSAEFPQLPISVTDKSSPESKFPALVTEQSHQEPESSTVVAEKSHQEPESSAVSTTKDNCSMCPFHKDCQDKLQCSAFLTGFGEHVAQNAETSHEDPDQKLFELLFRKKADT